MSTARRGLALALLLGALAPTSAAAQTPAPTPAVTWKMPNEYPATSIAGEGDTHFAGLLRAASGGRIEITHHFDASLGFRSRDLLEAVGKGTVPIGDAFVGALGAVDPIFLLPSLPFLAATAAEAQTLFEVARPEYERALARHNQKLLYVSPWPPSGIWATRPVTSAEALRGLRIRTYDANGTATLRAAGALPTQISFADAQARLRAGELDAVLSSGDGGAGARLWELLPHFTEINYAMPLSMVTLNLDVWNGLAPDLQRAVLEAAEATSRRQWAAMRDRVARNYERMQANGMTLTTAVPPEFAQALRLAGREATDDWLARMGPKGRDILDAFAARAPR
jgi:TRAP-type C4-dicarboxylate transport system substrate-binding protein